MKKSLIVLFLALGMVFLFTEPVFAQIPYATGVFGNTLTGTTTNQKNTSAGRFGTYIDDYMDTKGWSGIPFDQYFFFIGGRYMGRVDPVLGFATKFGDSYLSLYYRGTFVMGTDMTHNSSDTQWDDNGEGHSKFWLNNNFAVTYGVPYVGGFRFDWVASDSANATGPVFEKFKGETRPFDGETVDNAEGSISGSMAFILSYGNVFAKDFKFDISIGYATPETINVTGGQVGAEIFKYHETKASKIYVKVGVGYNINSTSSVDADYTTVYTPGIKFERTKGVVETSKVAEDEIRHVVNLSYGKTIGWDDKIIMKIKPNINFDYTVKQDIYKTESQKVDKGKENIFNIIPTLALGVQYKPTQKLSLYTGTTITLFDIQMKKGEKGADGATYGDNVSSSDFIQGSAAPFDIGASLQLTDTLSIDFNARALLTSVFVSASPTVDMYLTFRK